MRFKMDDDGNFIMIFRADEVDLGLEILQAMEPKSEADELSIQDCIDLLLTSNNLHKFRVIN